MMSTITTKQKFEAAAITKKAGKNWRDLKLSETPIKDGSPMVYDGEELMQGMPVFVETDTESGFEPYPDGVYTLEDGRNVEIVEGFVAKISEATAEGDTANPDQEQEKILTPEQEQAIKKITETHTKETIFAAVKKANEDGKTEFEASVKAEVEKQVTEIKESYEAKFSEHNKTVDDLTKVVQSLLDVLKASPADKPAETVLTEFQKEEKRKEDAKLAEADKLFQHTQNLRKQ